MKSEDKHPILTHISLSWVAQKTAPRKHGYTAESWKKLRKGHVFFGIIFEKDGFSSNYVGLLEAETTKYPVHGTKIADRHADIC